MQLHSDVAIDMVQGRAGTTVIARDHEGHFLGGRYTPYNGSTDLYVCEALGCRGAMVLAKEKRCTRVEVISDCKTVVED